MDWPYSSLQRYVERGHYNLEWGANDNVRSLEWNIANGGMRFAFPPYALIPGTTHTTLPAKK